MRNEMAAIVIIVALIAGAGAGYFGGAANSVTTTQTSITTTTATITVGQNCSESSPLPVLPDPTNQGYSWSVNYTGQWRATVVGITGNGSLALDQCYRGNGTGYVYTPDWSATGGTTLSVRASKTDTGTGTLTLALNGLTNSTSTTNGSVSLTAYIPVA
jgi:hypothetical protein